MRSLTAATAWIRRTETFVTAWVGSKGILTCFGSTFSGMGAAPPLESRLSKLEDLLESLREAIARPPVV